VQEFEIRILFLKISNRYAGFAYDDFKVEDWLELLKDVPVERATENLRRFCLNAANTFPPHPGILAENASQSSASNYVPNAQETLLLLDKWEQHLLTEGSSGIPETARERMRKLGYKSSARS
jgi:hypothetical protein